MLFRSYSLPFLPLTSVISVTHLLKGLSALKSRFSRSSDFRASRSAFGLAYSAQFLFLVTLVECGDVNEYLAQFLGLFIYGTVNFIVNKKLTFR